MNDFGNPDCSNNIPCILQNPYAPFEIPITLPPGNSIAGIREPGQMNYSQLRGGQYRNCGYPSNPCAQDTFNHGMCGTCSPNSGLGCPVSACDRRDCYECGMVRPNVQSGCSACNFQQCGGFNCSRSANVRERYNPEFGVYDGSIVRERMTPEGDTAQSETKMVGNINWMTFFMIVILIVNCVIAGVLLYDAWKSKPNYISPTQ